MCAGYCGCPAGSKADGNGNCVRTPPIVDECPRGTVQVCRGEAPNLTCSCAKPPPVTEDCTRADQLRGLCVPPPPPASRCPEGTSLVCNERDRCSCQPPGATPPPTTITCPPDTVKVCRGDFPDETKDCGCTPITPPPPPPAECAFPNVVVDGVCCKQSDYRPARAGRSRLQRLRSGATVRFGINCAAPVSRNGPTARDRRLHETAAAPRRMRSGAANDATADLTRQARSSAIVPLCSGWSAPRAAICWPR